MFGISALVKSIFDCISNFLNYQSARVENTESLSLVGDKKDLKKATNIAEEIIKIAEKYQGTMTSKDKRKLSSLVKKFNKVD